MNDLIFSLHVIASTRSIKDSFGIKLLFTNMATDFSFFMHEKRLEPGRFFPGARPGSNLLYKD
jgi:hypothetical protein